MFSVGTWWKRCWWGRRSQVYIGGVGDRRACSAIALLVLRFTSVWEGGRFGVGLSHYICRTDHGDLLNRDIHPMSSCRSLDSETDFRLVV